MDETEKNYVIEVVKKMLDDKCNISIFKFLIYNPEFVESNEKFKTTTIQKAKEFLKNLPKFIEEAKNEIKRNRYKILQHACQEYLEFFDKN